MHININECIWLLNMRWILFKNIWIDFKITEINQNLSITETSKDQIQIWPQNALSTLLPVEKKFSRYLHRKYYSIMRIKASSAEGRFSCCDCKHVTIFVNKRELFWFCDQIGKACFCTYDRSWVFCW